MLEGNFSERDAADVMVIVKDLVLEFSVAFGNPPQNRIEHRGILAFFSRPLRAS